MSGSRDAMIIATGSYQDPELRRLRSPAQDAVALERVLSDPAIGGFKVRSVLEQPERVIRREAHLFFADRGLDDLLLLHISCHGVKDDDGRLYFAAADTETKLLAPTAVSASFLNDLMEECRARSIVLLLDCCYSGAFLPGAKGDEGVHLKEKFEGEGRAILTASNAIEYSWEGKDLSGEGAPSIFTAAIAEGLKSGEADRDRDGKVSINDLYKYAYQRVRAERPGQKPMMWALGIEDDLYVARNPHPIEPQSVPLPGALREALESPLSSVRAGIIEDLARLLSSTNPGLALAAREALEGLKQDDSRSVSTAAQKALMGRPTAEEDEQGDLKEVDEDGEESGEGDSPALPSSGRLPLLQRLRARPKIFVGIGIVAVLLGVLTAIVIASDDDGPGVVLIADDFSSEEHNWKADGNGEGRYESGTYLISARRDDATSRVGAAPDMDATDRDIGVKVDAHRIGGTSSEGFGYGVFCRATDLMNGYVFTIWNKHASMRKLTDGTFEQLGEDSSAVQAPVDGDTTKELQAVCATVEGDGAVDLQFIVDDEVILTHTDGDNPHLSGLAGIQAVLAPNAEFGQTLEVEFDNFELSEITDSADSLRR